MGTPTKLSQLSKDQVATVVKTAGAGESEVLVH